LVKSISEDNYVSDTGDVVFYQTDNKSKQAWFSLTYTLACSIGRLYSEPWLIMLPFSLHAMSIAAAKVLDMQFRNQDIIFIILHRKLQPCANNWTDLFDSNCINSIEFVVEGIPLWSSNCGCKCKSEPKRFVLLRMPSSIQISVWNFLLRLNRFVWL
jgi:hypothetical protein